MPIHNWSRMPAGLFHDFLQSWTVRIKIALNDGLLPNGYSALVAHLRNTADAFSWRRPFAKVAC